MEKRDIRNKASETTTQKAEINKQIEELKELKKELRDNNKKTIEIMGILLGVFALIGMNVSFLPKMPTDNVYHMIVFAVLLNIIVVTAIITLFMFIDVITAPRKDTATKKKELVTNIFYSFGILFVLCLIGKQVFDKEKPEALKETIQSSDTYQNYNYEKPDLEINTEDNKPVIIPEQNSIIKNNTENENNENNELNEIDGEKNPDLENQDKEESFFPPAPRN